MNVHDNVILKNMNTNEDILVVENVSKSFDTQRGVLEILKDVSFSVKKGEKVAIIGPSGSGKSSLLSLIGLLDRPTQGTLHINGVDVSSLSELEQARFRNEQIGFIFQSFELISPFTVMENITAPLEIGNVAVDTEKVGTLIGQLGLTDRTSALPNTLSGGEKQRVAIGRALARTPSLILADEPTGSLDRATGERVLSLLLDSVSESNTTLIIITHDESIADRMDRVFELRDMSLHERD